MMSNTLDEVIAFLDDLEARRPTREDLDKVYFPIVETIARIKDETSMETLVWRYAASPAWIIPYNLAHAVTHNEGTFSTPLLVALIEKLPTNPVHDLLHQYLAYLQVHVERNLAGLKKSLPHMREFVITAASYAGVGDGLVRMFLYELLRCVLDKGMFMEFFPPDDAVNLRRALESEEIAGSSHLPRSPVEADDYDQLRALGVTNPELISAVTYFANDFDTTTQGLDLVANYTDNWFSGKTMSLCRI